MNDFPKRTDDVRLDRDATREELAETITALGDKFDVKTRVQKTVGEKLDQVETKVADVAGPRNAARVRHGAEVVRGNPVPVFAGLLVLMVVIRLLVRRRS
ncbi:MAG TPA: DUF3618 domain-containing protein [Amycolatopsis sp.]|nr:DUF3618 domain-containing protein [Amycolatopsis sp.]